MNLRRSAWRTSYSGKGNRGWKRCSSRSTHATISTHPDTGPHRSDREKGTADDPDRASTCANRFSPLHGHFGDTPGPVLARVRGPHLASGASLLQSGSTLLHPVTRTESPFVSNPDCDRKSLTR